MTATDTTTRIIASAVTADGYGDREVIVQPQTVEFDDYGDVDYLGILDGVIAQAPLPPADETVAVRDDFDALLAELGYRRVAEWETTDFGAVAIVESL